MNAEQQEQFKAEFQRIVYKKGLITESNTRIKTLSRWDKNGSHQKAIVVEIEIRDKHKKELTAMLKGKTYEQWKAYSMMLTRLNRRLKTYKKLTEDIKATINNLIF